MSSGSPLVASPARDAYRFIGRVYDGLGRVYGGAPLAECRVAMFDRLAPGDRVLFAGAGSGRDVLVAARAGANVTALDLSPTMLSALQRKAASEGLSVRAVLGDIAHFAEVGAYDWVVANFFLNVFAPHEVQPALRRLVALTKPRGSVVIGDFAFPSGGRLQRAVQNCHWYLPLMVFAGAAGNAIHEIYDYPELMRSSGLRVERQKVFGRFGVPLYWSLMGAKSTDSG